MLLAYTHYECNMTTCLACAKQWLVVLNRFSDHHVYDRDPLLIRSILDKSHQANPTAIIFARTDACTDSRMI